MKKCVYCEKIFPTVLDLLYHEEDDHEKIISRTCEVCGKKCPTRSAYLRHRQINHQTSNLESFLKERYENISVEPSSRKVARVEIQKVLDALRETFGCGIFLKQFRKSGSYSTDTKVLHADEFDFDVPLRFSLEELHLNREGDKVYYHFHQKQRTLNLNVPMYVYRTRGWFTVPQGYVEIRTAYRDPVVSRLIQQELYNVLLKAKEMLKDCAMDIRCEAKGPALTLTIKKEGLPNISVDLCASIATNQITLADYNWPRPQTRKILSKRLINSIFDAGLHLIPKHLKFWYVSESRAGQALMNGIDNDKGCRKKCHKLLKADFQTWLGRSGNNLPGISTMIFKHQLFWLNEEKQLDWSQENLADRYLDMLDDLAVRLRSGVLYNYFFDYQNILEDKDQQILNQVANHAEARRQELEAKG
ncbi:cyclic GMP-AMP synthase-like [Hydractinia symbiolongicarpus]|uniref:cyclic GMP-AMP synthase-like n=1 Tax=Hydractinia symbiolongicarpus TaxID=13093 RepID=UPI00254A751D|nr:cyclic GMP-AMP synthase-like [Hydractinia symbiolongicarpus]